MILGDSVPGKASRVTLDEMFKRTAQRRPDATALRDPHRTMTYAQADAAIGALAHRLRDLGLPVDSVVAMHLPNGIESVIALLAVLRAGMIAAPMPLLWRRAEAVAALGSVGARALIAGGRVGEADCGELALHVAASVFQIRQVCGFRCGAGADLPDGIVALDDLLQAAAPDGEIDNSRDGDPAAHVAVVTWDVTAEGLTPVARSHNELLAGGLPVLLEAGGAQQAALLGAVPLSSFAGLSAVLLPWLLSGGALTLHPPFDAALLETQLRAGGAQIAVLPGPVTARLNDSGRLPSRLAALVAVWRAPERLTAAPLWRRPDLAFVDLTAFGEIALLAARRGADGRPQPIPLGTIAAPRGTPGAVAVLDVGRSDNGTLTVRGPMLPRAPFPPGAARSGRPGLAVNADGSIDTGFTCRPDARRTHLVVTGPPAGLVSVGGYRFLLRELQEQVAAIDPTATLAALPDAFSGHRLAGTAANRAEVQRALAELGANPLVVAAFRERRGRLDRASAA